MRRSDASAIGHGEAVARSQGWRGWFAGRTAWRDIVDRSGLPEEIRALIARLTLAAGGSGRERTETAAELVSHFVEAIERGATPDEARQRFGDERQAAALFRRAIRRKRGPFAKAWWWSSRAAALGLVGIALGYGVLALRFYIAEPTIAVHSLNALRELTPAVAPDEHAWPLYRPALIAMQQAERRLAEERDPAADDWFSASDPDSTSWARGASLLSTHAAELAALRDGSRRASLGLAIGVLDPADEPLFSASAMTTDGLFGDEDNPPVFGVLLPHLSHLRRGARWLGAEALHAAHAGDGARCVESIEAILGLARQCRRPLIIEQLVSFAIAGLAVDRVERALALAPRSFDAALLARLDAMLTGMPDEALTADFRGETIAFEDFLQRVYTDDGDGDGHVTASILAAGFGTPDARDRLLGPGMLIVMPSRRVLHEAHLESVATAERVARRPSWTWRDEKPATSPRLVGSWRDVLLEPIVQPSSLVRSATAGPWMRARRDVTRVIVALHRHHAESGAWPDSLASLVGPYLDALPPDAYSGDTLRYEVREGVPYLWSVGEDGVDDRLSAAVTAWTGSPLATAEAANDERTQRPIVRVDVQFWPPVQDD